MCLTMAYPENLENCQVALVQMQNNFPSSAAAGDNAATLLQLKL